MSAKFPRGGGAGTFLARSLYGYVSVDICKKRKEWFKYRDMYCSCTDPERFVQGGPTLTKVF